MTDATLMAKLPSPEVYEQEYVFWPWGDLLEAVARRLQSEAPRNAHIVDYMCGTGYLLSRVRALRDDVTLEGCDIDSSFVAYGTAHYGGVLIREYDARRYRPQTPPSIVLCTAGIHHLTRPDQQSFVSKVAAELPVGGWFVVGEEVLSAFSHERGRRTAVVDLTSALLGYAIERDAPAAVLEAGADVLANDLLQRGEYKLSLIELRALLATTFDIVSVEYTWRVDDGDAGDVVLFCRKRS